MSTTTAPATAPEAEGHAGHDHHPPHLKHYFVSSDQQFDASKMGMWLFLLTEVLLFSGMFVAYIVYRAWHPEVFVKMSELLNPFWGGFNTLVLLGSSFSVALAIHYAQKNDNKKLVMNLAITLFCAGIFMVVKYIEYTDKFSHGIGMGEFFDPTGSYAQYAIPYAKQFFSIYFVMTGIHGFHVVIGMGIFTWLLIRARKGHFNSEYYTPVELAGLYWHLVDIIWIFLFPLLYLI
ncbi:MAG: cytochrome c oxidase subunit 3 family protein [Bacteroidota bacterium]